MYLFYLVQEKLVLFNTVVFSVCDSNKKNLRRKHTLRTTARFTVNVGVSRKKPIH